MEGDGRRKKGAGGSYKLNGGYGGPQPQLGRGEDRLRSGARLQGPGSATKFLEFVAGHVKSTATNLGELQRYMDVIYQT